MDSRIEHRETAYGHERILPKIRMAQDGCKTSEEVNPRFHHRRRMKVSRNRSRCFHRSRKPKMKRKLSGFGKCAYENKADKEGIEGMADQHFPFVYQLANDIGSCNVA